MDSGDQSDDRSLDSLSHFSLLVSFQLARNAKTIMIVAATFQLYSMIASVVMSMIVLLVVGLCRIGSGWPCVSRLFEILHFPLPMLPHVLGPCVLTILPLFCCVLVLPNLE